MNFFLRLKHWQLFVLLVPTSIVSFVIRMLANPEFLLVQIPAELLMVASVLISACNIIFTLYLFTLGESLLKKLPEGLIVNQSLFRTLIYISLIHSIVMGIYKLTHSGLTVNQVESNKIITTIASFAGFLISGGLIYAISLIAKSLKSVELQKPVNNIGDYVGEAALLLFYPVGIWNIQPRVNKVFEDEPFADLN